MNHPPPPKLPMPHRQNRGAAEQTGLHSCDNKTTYLFVEPTACSKIQNKKHKK